jgi:hypothetical protein
MKGPGVFGEEAFSIWIDYARQRLPTPWRCSVMELQKTQYAHLRSSKDDFRL